MKPLIASLLLLTVSLLIPGCGKKATSVLPHPHSLPASPLVTKSEPGLPGGQLTLALPASPKTFNPFEVNDTASDLIVHLIFASLINLDWEHQEAGPGLAESWSVAPDHRTWTFKLREGVRWSDGQRLSADDVVFTWNDLMLHPELNHFTSDLFRINGQPFQVTKVDDLTIRVVTSEVFAPMLDFFGTVPILPRHTLEYAVQQNHFRSAYAAGAPPASVVGSGPYRVKEFQPGKFTLLERNPEYWVTDKQGRRLPYFDEVRLLASGGPGSDVLLFLNGKSDVFENIRPDVFDQFTQAATNFHFKVLELGLGAEREFLWFNQNTGMNSAGVPIVSPAKLKWFQNKKFRQAVSCAIDRDRIAREAYRNRAQPIYGFISTENQKWNNPGVPRFDHNPERARSLLAEMGIQDRKGAGLAEDAEGHPIEITLHSNTGNPLREKAAALIIEDLGKVGIKLVFAPIGFDALRQRIDDTFDYECALIGLAGGGTDPASQLNVLKSSEPLHQWFPLQKTPSTEWEARIDSLMEAQMRTLDFAARKKAFDEVQSILADELPMIYTISPIAGCAIRENIANIRPAIMTPFRLTWNIDELYFKK